MIKNNLEQPFDNKHKAELPVGYYLFKPQKMNKKTAVKFSTSSFHNTKKYIVASKYRPIANIL